MTTVEIPANGWRPRPYQLPFWLHMEQGGFGGKRAVAVWHRRAGKDSTSINLAAVGACEKVANYWHMLPTAVQGRKVIWEGIDKEGRRIIDQAFPPEIRVPGNRGQNESEMLIRLRNGSTYQVVGSDNYDRLVGSNPYGIVFSEYSIANPSAWDYFRPILRENGGWAAFIYTSRGMTHGWDLYQMALSNPAWFSELLTIEDTGVMSRADMEEEIRAGMLPEMAEQEFMCSFLAAVPGSYYGTLLARADKEGRTQLQIPYNPAKELHFCYDIGKGFNTCVWAFQPTGFSINWLWWYAGSTPGLEETARAVREEIDARGWAPTMHWFPHDVDDTDVWVGRRRLDMLKDLGLYPARIVPKMPVEAGIAHVRSVLPVSYFAGDTAKGVDALRQYHSEYDEVRRTFSLKPVHDWSSHTADSFRYGASAIMVVMGNRPLRQTGAGPGTRIANVSGWQPRRTAKMVMGKLR